ncbi:MAG: amidohydrolase family protein [Porticoccaceae bacterium]|nr:amidohydrolase family protein [Porticoccaceae bacterium]
MKLFRIILSLVIYSFLHSSFSFAEKPGDKFIVEKSPIIAFTNARVIDGTGRSAKDKQTVLIRDGRIISTGRGDTIKIPKEAKIVSLKGKSLLPGWVMTHEHLYYLTNWLGYTDKTFLSGRMRTNHPIAYPRLYLSAGVTSARTMGTHAAYIDLNAKEMVESGINPGPYLDVTAPFINEVTGPEEVREHVRFWASRGATSIKTYADVNRAELAAAVDEAHKLGLSVNGHICAVTYREAVDQGIDLIVHGFGGIISGDLNPNKELDICPYSKKAKSEGVHVTATDYSVMSASNPEVTELFQHIIDNDVFVEITPAVLDVIVNPLPKEVLDYFNEAGLEDYKDLRVWAGKRISGDRKEIYKERIRKSAEMDTLFWSMGGKLTVGSDAAGAGTVAGWSNLRAIEMLAEGGIPLLEVIKIATHNGAEALDLLNDRGTIEVGKRADLLVIDGDPSKSIYDIQKIETVFKNGVGYDPTALKKSILGTVGSLGRPK